MKLRHRAYRAAITAFEEARLNTGLSFRQLQKCCGVDASTIHRFTRGKAINVFNFIALMQWLEKYHAK